MPMGSPKGTIHIYPDNVSDEEKEKKQDNRGSIGQELEEKTASQYIDHWLPDNNSYLFLVYPQNVDGRDLDGCYWIAINEIQPDKPAFKFYGTTLDFVRQFKHAIPMLDSIVVNDLPKSIIKILSHEFPKYGIKLFTDNPIEKKSDRPFEKIKTNMDVINKMSDPYHKGRGIKVGRIDRILKIAESISRKTHFVRPAAVDEEGPWVVAPKKPSNPDEPEAIKSFKTRDAAAAWLKNKESTPEDEDEKSITANIMHDWMEPEEAADVAWSLRNKENKS